MPPAAFGFTTATRRPYDAPLLRGVGGYTVRIDQDVRFGIGGHPGDPNRRCDGGGGRRPQCSSEADRERAAYSGNYVRLATVKAPITLPTSEIADTSWRIGKPLRILVVDNYPAFRAGLRAMLAALPDTEVIGEATNGRQAVKVVGERQPEVVVLGLELPDMCGIEATRRIVAAHPSVGILVLTTLGDDDTAVLGILREGVRGCLSRSADGTEIVRAIEVVAGGATILGSVIACRVFALFAGGPTASMPKPFPELTDREREVLELIACGECNTSIARLLVLSPKTVRNHISSIFTKLQVPDRSQAIVRARRAGLGWDGPSRRYLRESREVPGRVGTVLP